MSPTTPLARLAPLAAIAALGLGLTACGGADDSSADGGAADALQTATDPGIRVVDPETAAPLVDDPAITVIDLRTPEEFAEGHLAGATMIDFYADDFRDRLADLDPDESYLIYCRSGNRSGQTREIMAELGFGDVVDVDGGIVAWSGAGLPVVTD